MIPSRFHKRFTAFLLAVLMVCSMFVPVSAVSEEKNGLSFRKIGSGAVSAVLPLRAFESPENAEEPYAPDDIVRVSIVLEDVPVLTAAVGSTKLAENTAALRYRKTLLSRQKLVAERITETVLDGETLDVVWNITLAANMISANVPYGKIDEIRKVNGIDDVVIENRYEPCAAASGEAADPMMATSGEMIGTTPVWEAGYTGAGTRIAVIDTGIDLDHISFDAGAYEYAVGLAGGSYDLLDESEIAAVWDQLHIASRLGSSDGTYFNAKVPFGANYVDSNLNITHDNDRQGEHGSHVAGIAAANRYIPDGKGGYQKALDSVAVQGTAPDAQLIIMKVFGAKGGAYDSDYMAAIEDAIVLGADAVNLSLGSASAGNSVSENYQRVMDRIAGTDVVLTVSAGNNGAWGDNLIDGMIYSDSVALDTVGSPGSFTNSLTVASVENDGMTGNYIGCGGTKIFYNESTGYKNAPLTTLSGTYDYVFIDKIGTAEDFEAVKSVLNGKIAICRRGDISFSEKANHAVEAGAVAVFICDASYSSTTVLMNLSDYLYTAPCVWLPYTAGQAIIEASETVTDGDGGILYYTGSLELRGSTGYENFFSDSYTMSDFSAWGVPGSLELKPEITAPGGNIYSVDGSVPGGRAYEVMSGTSMAAPQIAGLSALMAQYVRENGLDTETGLSVRQLTQSLLMSTAIPVEDTMYGMVPVIRQGAGLVNIAAAMNADSVITMDPSATASAYDGKVKAELGDDPKRVGQYDVTFTLRNIGDSAKIYSFDAAMYTQEIFRDDPEGTRLFPWTVLLDSETEWLVNGEPIGGDAVLPATYDFNGDGTVDGLDADHILDYVTGKIDAVTNDTYADLDEDGDIDSFDAHLFLQMLNSNSILIAAGDSEEITARIRLLNIKDYDDCGAFVEGYLYVMSEDTEEGVTGCRHSIPVLGYYGSWTEPSMIDVGSYVEYMHGLESRTPYMYGAYKEDAKLFNAYTIIYAGDSKKYYFGGNPFGDIVPDAVYDPARNAVNNQNGDKFASVTFSPIRNASASYLSIVGEDGEVYLMQSSGAVTAAYVAYDENTKTYRWGNYLLEKAINRVPTDMQENTAGRISFMLVPEYYVGENGADLTDVHENASFGIDFTIDNTAPTVSDIELNDDMQLIVTASDNQYISAVILWDATGKKRLAYAGADMNAGAGDVSEFVLDCSDVNEKSAILQVYDYALNDVTVEITERIGERTIPSFYAFTVSGTGDNAVCGWTAGEFEDGETVFGECMAVNDPYISAAEGKGLIFAVNGTGNLYVMDAETPQVRRFAGKLPLGVEDLAFNPADEYLYAVVCEANGSSLIRIDPMTGEYTKAADLSSSYDTLAADNDGAFYFTAAGTDGGIVKYENGNTEPITADFGDTVSGSYRYRSAGISTEDGYYYLFNSGDSGTTLIRADLSDGSVTVMDHDLASDVSCFVLTDPSHKTDWVEENDTVTAVVMEKDELRITVSERVQADAYVLPWNSSDGSVTWSSSDPDTVTVDENGVIRGIAVGSAVITAASVKDPTVQAECAVTVDKYPTVLYAAARDASGRSVILSRDLENGSTWEKAGDLAKNTAAITCYSLEKPYRLYQLDTKGYLHVLDWENGAFAITETSDSVIGIGALLSDMDAAYYASQQNGDAVLFGIYNDWLMKSVPAISNTFNSGWRLGSLIEAYTNSEKFVALASAGVNEKEDGTTEDVFYALTDNGYIWGLFYDGTGSLGLGYYPTTLDLPEAKAINGPICSMVMDQTGTLYVSCFDGADNAVYALTFDDSFGGFAAEKIDEVDANGPIRLFCQNPANEKGNEDLSFITADLHAASVNVKDAESVMNVGAFEGEQVMEKAERADGTLQSFLSKDRGSADDAPLTAARDAIFTLNVTTESISANGEMTVTYDPAQAELVSASGCLDHVSVHAEDDGTVKIAYAAADTIAADTTAARLVFRSKTFAEIGIDIDYTALDDQDTYDADETLSVNEGAEEVHATVLGSTLALNGLIEVMFKLDIPDEVLALKPYAELTYTGITSESITVDAAEAWSDTEKGYVFRFPVAPKEILDKVALRLYSEDGTLLALYKGSKNPVPLENNVRYYSVQDYITAVKKTENAADKLLAMVAALQDYCAACRLQFNYQTDGASIENDLAKLTADMLEAYKSVSSDTTVSGIRNSGKTLVLESGTKIYIKYTLDADADIGDYTFTCNGKAVEPVPYGKDYCVIIDRITSTMLDKTYIVKVSDAEGNSHSVSYSAYSYIYSALQNGDATTATVARALYYYGEAAHVMFGY